MTLTHFRSTKKKWIWRKLARLCEKSLERYSGFSYDFERGGEKNILQRLSNVEFRTVFDVGANIGEWTLTARPFFPKAVFHTFEISNSTFQTLGENLTGDSFVNNNVGLSDSNCTIEYKDYGSHSRVNTLLMNADYHDPRNPPKTLKANVVTGDSYCSSHKISFIDFLKIDVEGTEHLVMKGFDQFLSAGSIRCLQFEYGYTHGDAKFLMRDFFKLLNEKNYIIGKVRRGDIEFLVFDYKLNDFNSGPNYIAVRKTDSEIISLLTGRSNTAFSAK